MAIYTRFGSRVALLSARMIPVWIEHTGAAIKWHYRERLPTKRTKELRESPEWFVTGRFDDDREGHGGQKPLHDGKLAFWGGFVADDGAKEILTRCQELAPQELEKFERWNRADGPKASELFELADTKSIWNF